MNAELIREVGERLKAARTAAQLTQADVARDFQITRQAVSAWERGVHLPSVNELYALCLLYGTSSDFLLFGMRTVPASSKPVIQDLFRLRSETPKEG